jgi:hypothetical protein
MYQTTWRQISEDSNLHSHHCENLKSYIKIIFPYEVRKVGYIRMAEM